MTTAEEIRATLRAVWHVAVDGCTEVAGGDGTRWTVALDTGPAEVRLDRTRPRAVLIAALATAETLGRAGLPIAQPLRTAAGVLSVGTSGGEMCLVRAVPGRPLDPSDPIDQQWWGDLLGRAHTASRHLRAPGTESLVVPGAGPAPHLSVAPWLREALRDVAAAVTRLSVTDQLTYGLLHGDPAPDAFRIDPASGRTSLTGWGVPLHGQLVYDLAVAVRYAGGPAAARDLIDAYVAVAPVGRDEVTVALPVLLRLHWALIADRHARALAAIGPRTPVPRAAGEAVAARRDQLERVREVLAGLAGADRAD